ncbi:MAG TPA: glutathionylspermidine synthase family protein [Planktothrix sp.]
MRFHEFSARPGWREQTRELGYLASILDDPPYWVEALERPFCAAFERSELRDRLLPATQELNELACALVDDVCRSKHSERYFEQLRIDSSFREPIRRSWLRHDRTLYGRFDFSYSTAHPKLLELNFDTPASLYEAAVLQYLWLEDKRGHDGIAADAGQFNELHDRLVAAFEQIIPKERLVHFAAMEDAPEDEETAKYLQSTAVLAGLQTKFFHMHRMRCNKAGVFIDDSGLAITDIFKFYPWEFLLAEDLEIQRSKGRSGLAAAVSSGMTRFIEPCWKIILSNKACLPLLWQLAPNHKNLLPASFDDYSAEATAIKQRPYVRKPIFGREGGSVSLVYPGDEANNLHTESEYGGEGFILQELNALPVYGEFHVLLGSWMVNGEPCGLGIRADRSRITSTRTLFVPHYVH